jgi:hypothetical protein
MTVSRTPSVRPFSRKNPPLDESFAYLCELALAGLRCPENHKDTLVRSEVVRLLAEAGRVRVTISGRNWRTVEILTGPHAGKSTKRNPSGSKPHIMTDHNGVHRKGGGLVPTPRRIKRQQPSAPRLLTRAEIER